jgi:hypothetical protein
MTKTFSPVGVDFDVASTVAQVALNTESLSSAGMGVYVVAASAVAQYDVVSIDQAGNAVPITTTTANNGGRIGFAQVAIAQNSFATVATEGAGFLISVAALAPINTRLYTTNTAGTLGASATSHAEIIGVTIGTSNTGTATATTGMANFPHVDI